MSREATDEAGARIALLSAYRADSHGVWADWLRSRFPDIRWISAELPGRHFRWRIRGNPLAWLDTLDGAAPDAVVATSMVDLATLRGLNSGLAAAPAMYYFHENQFAYPSGSRQVSSIEPQMVQLYGALAADLIVFNSRFNRDSFLDGVGALLRRLPGPVPDNVPERLAQRASVLPVPIQPIAPSGSARDERLIVWNHRWEYDKAPERFAAAMSELANRGIEFRLALLGRRPAQRPPTALARLREELGARIIADGQLPRADYEALLGRAGIAVSTALHEFQGLAVLEAASAGAAPLVPDALVYPEQFPERYRYPAGDVSGLVDKLARWLEHGPPPAPDVSAWTDEALVSPWRRALQSLSASRAS